MRVCVRASERKRRRRRKVAVQHEDSLSEYEGAKAHEVADANEGSKAARNVYCLLNIAPASLNAPRSSAVRPPPHH